MVAFLRNQREQTGFLGLGVRLFSQPAGIFRFLPLSLSLWFSNMIAAVPTTVAPVTNPEEDLYLIV